jgi:hypothetical protein
VIVTDLSRLKTALLCSLEHIYQKGRNQIVATDLAALANDATL